MGGNEQTPGAAITILSGFLWIFLKWFCDEINYGGLLVTLEFLRFVCVQRVERKMASSQNAEQRQLHSIIRVARGIRSTRAAHVTRWRLEFNFQVNCMNGFWLPKLIVSDDSN